MSCPAVRLSVGISKALATGSLGVNGTEPYWEHWNHSMDFIEGKENAGMGSP